MKYLVILMVLVGASCFIQEARDKRIREREEKLQQMQDICKTMDLQLLEIIHGKAKNQYICVAHIFDN